jgi:serine phosphatase RsbU (regulator of sigma subunit)
LLEVTRALAAEIDLPTILRTITHEACTALQCDRASLYQYDPEAEELYTTIVTELEVAEIRKKLGQGISGAVAQTRQLANVADPHSDPRWDSSVDRATGYRTQSILAAPLLSPDGSTLLGVLELINKLEGAFDSTDEELLAAFGQHAAVALDRARMVEALQQQEATRASLEVARQIQQSFMPRNLPEVPGYEAASWWYPNEAVGGDYCDLLPLADGRAGLVIADVSGHGLGPSLLMASVRAALRALLLEHSSPEAVLSRLAWALAADLRDGRFITIVLAALDPRTHRLEFANGGHAPALHYRAAADRFEPLESTGLPLGVLDEPEYPAGPPIDLGPGDMLVLCTDGIVEAMDSDGRPFGQGRLVELLRELAGGPVSDLVERVGRAVEEHYAGSSPPDDLTILVVRRRADA